MDHQRRKLRCIIFVILDVVSADKAILDLLGVIVVGTPDDNEDKILVGTRAAVMAECMRADGVIISSDGWGNSDVDYANTCEQLGIRDRSEIQRREWWICGRK